MAISLHKYVYLFNFENIICYFYMYEIYNNNFMRESLCLAHIIIS